MKSFRNVIFFILVAMVLFCRVSFADSPGMETESEDTVAIVIDSIPDSYTKEEIDTMLSEIINSILEIPKRYTDEEIDNKISEIKESISDASDNYTNEDIDYRIAAVKKSLPETPDVYSKEEIKIRIRALNDAISNLEIALSDIRNSIPAEIKWPVKTKKILKGIRDSIPADISGPKE